MTDAATDNADTPAGPGPEETPAASKPSTFSVFRVQNPSAAGVHITTNAELINGTTQPRVDLVQGRLQVNAGSAFTLNRGNVRLGSLTNLNLLGDIVNANSCSGRTTNNATVTGSGNFNGAPITATTCTP